MGAKIDISLNTQDFSPRLVLLAKYNQNAQVKEDEMGRACSLHEKVEECI
jgi:hypothetical protein